MKLASVALVLGGTALGTQIGDTQVYEELHTERLYLHSKERDRIASISATDSAGLLISLGDAQSLATAKVEIAPEMHRWKLSFTHESGASFVVALDSTGASQLLSSGEDGAEAYCEAGNYGEQSGMAFSRYHPGKGAAPGEACSIGAEGLSENTPEAFLRLRRQEPWDQVDPQALPPVWQNILQIGGDEAFLVSPWVRKPR